jgi:hypothetical protein
MSLALACIAAALLLRALLLQRRIARHPVLRSRRWGGGLLSRELRRFTHLASHRGLDGERTLPTPLETRILVWRCAGLPWRAQVQSVGLPNRVADCVASVAPANFDSLFSTPFRCGTADSASKRLGAPTLVQ